MGEGERGRLETRLQQPRRSRAGPDISQVADGSRWDQVIGLARGVGPSTAACNITLSARDLLEPSQALDVVVDVPDAVHGVQHHHVST